MQTIEGEDFTELKCADGGGQIASDVQVGKGDTAACKSDIWKQRKWLIGRKTDLKVRT